MMLISEKCAAASDLLDCVYQPVAGGVAPSYVLNQSLQLHRCTSEFSAISRVERLHFSKYDLSLRPSVNDRSAWIAKAQNLPRLDEKKKSLLNGEKISCRPARYDEVPAVESTPEDQVVA